MQALVAQVRGAGAVQPIVVAGLRSGSDLSGWLKHEPNDPGAPGLGPQLIAGVHLYWQLGDERHCRGDDVSPSACALSLQRSFWDATVAPVARTVPVLAAELGEFDCGHTYVDAYMDWADVHGVSYLGWAWNTEACDDFPALVTDYGGTATPYGAGLCAHLAALASSPPPRACIV
jgi:hypothetical protein